MPFFEYFLWSISIWTFVEGSIVTFLPETSLKLTRRFFPKWGAILEAYPKKELRTLGAIELAFALLLGAYLFFFT